MDEIREFPHEPIPGPSSFLFVPERFRGEVDVADQPVNFTRSEALQFRISIRVAVAVPKFPPRLK